MSAPEHVFPAPERERVEAAIAEAERTTAGELVVCVSARSGRYDRGEDLFGVMLGLVVVALTWVLLQDVVDAGWGPMPALGLIPVLLLFLGGFLVGAVLATRIPALGLLFTTRAEMDAEVAERARTAFHRFGVHGTREATGILIYVSLLERRVQVVGDETINARIAQAQWDDMRDKIVAGFRAGKPADGLVEAVREAGELLAEHVPGSHDDEDELDNSIRFLDA